MSFLERLLVKKPEPSYVEKTKHFSAELLKIEENHPQYFKKEFTELAGVFPDQLENHYTLRKEFEYIRFDYRPDSDLPGYIRAACDAAYQKVWGNN